MSARVWITVPQPATNGEMHIGHLAGPYIAADVLHRFLRAENVPSVLTTGLDITESHVAMRALKEGVKPIEAADEYCGLIVRAWSEAAIDFDEIVVPQRDPGYESFVQRFFGRLYEQGVIVPRTRPLPYCAKCERWLHDAYVSGGCPHCGSESGGSICEICSMPNDNADLTAPRCAICERPAQLRSCERLFLPLAPFEQRLAEFWEQADMTPQVRALCENLTAEGLPELAVSHPVDWGVPTAVPGFDDQRILPWVEMAPSYLRQLPASHGPPPADTVQFFGIDNSFFQAVLIPVLFSAYAPAGNLPSKLVTNEFYLLNGAKFSTSRRHVVWALEALDAFGADTVRFHVLADRPTGRQTSFTAAELERTSDHLRHRWSGWLHRLLTAVESDCGGVVPDLPPSGPAWSELAGRLRRCVAELSEAYSINGFDPRRATALLDEIVACAEDFGHVQAHHRDRPQGRSAYEQALVAQLAVAAGLTAWAAPVLPRGAERLAALLGLPHFGPVHVDALRPPVPGTRLPVPAEPVFGKRRSA
ncbi:methionyl-tRNA synthetase [Murinocardiopsis flavida]|uniref:Methionyl-tRNA synthetase n=1 Tax=Murinocardiopsis flavida TaxID=645275 RepID=A0A2P8D182_9ACTN|nr:class I tRNA ligase family protein [Murinocardiopsis flavida]PSK90961.1 methionyl-tRNA synthetase [Murinocardiopsis flavida]